ncbi:MAG: YfiR family protein [Methylophilaceae bacterium]|nr:YfiR family protein [Methylophilaceae bacterium]
MSFKFISAISFRQRLLLSCLGLLFAPMAVNANAATVAEESELKAAFIYNFSLFTTWPKIDKNLRLCVLGAETYTSLLAKYEGRSVQGALIHVEQVASAQAARNCQLLFVDTNDQANEQTMDAINKALEGAPVLTVGESGKVNPASVMILLTQDNGRVAFEINQGAATGAGITLSSKLLKLAKKVH